MSEFIGHECGLALVRLRQPLSYFRERYGDAAWGTRRLYLLMEKQRNRGQDGAGIAAAKFDMPPGERFLKRIRTDRPNSLERLFDVITRDLPQLAEPSMQQASDVAMKRACEFLGEVYLGHLRYTTHSHSALTNCHPLVRKHNVASRNLAIAGNFNMTNSETLFRQLIEDGLNPTGDSDTQVILERIGHALDLEHRHLRNTMGPESFRGLDGRELAVEVSKEIDLNRILSKAAVGWDGGYVFGAVLGNGDAFVCRDPAGIRPGFFLITDEVVAAASERAALANVFDVEISEIEPILPGHALTIKRDGRIGHEPFSEPLPLRQCTFERIYFSRGNDPDIYRERKQLGRNLAPRVLDALGGDASRAVFSFIPNTSESAYLGFVEEIEHIVRNREVDAVWERIQRGEVSREDLEHLRNGRVRAEKVAHKDQRLRTFITHDAARRDLVLHIYDITRDIVKPDDTLVVIDDSIVRGTTLRESVITILSRLHPKRIIVASSAPPIMYPDCYGIDMSQLGRFIAFEAAVTLLHELGEEALLDEVEAKCAAQADGPPERMVNHVKAIYERFTLDELSAKIAELVRPRTTAWGGQVDVIYQSIEGLQSAMPEHTGDWYFTGDYPTPGGYRVLNKSFLNWRARQDVRAY